MDGMASVRLHLSSAHSFPLGYQGAGCLVLCTLGDPVSHLPTPTPLLGAQGMHGQLMESWLCRNLSNGGCPPQPPTHGHVQTVLPWDELGFLAPGAFLPLGTAPGWLPFSSAPLIACPNSW